MAANPPPVPVPTPAAAPPRMRASAALAPPVPLMMPVTSPLTLSHPSLVGRRVMFRAASPIGSSPGCSDPPGWPPSGFQKELGFNIGRAGPSPAMILRPTDQALISTNKIARCKPVEMIHGETFGNHEAIPNRAMPYNIPQFHHLQQRLA